MPPPSTAIQVRLLAALLAWLPPAFPWIAAAELPPAATDPVDFVRDIRPLFEKHCIKCHGPEKQKADLRLDGKAAAMRGVTDGPVILPGRGAESRLVAAVAGVDEDLVMPPKGDPLTPEQVGKLRRWIDDGAQWPDEAPGRDPIKSHWSFQPVHRPAIPAGQGTNPIDAFISAKLAAKGIALSLPADPRTLIRRMTFDMLGLPPSPQEIDAFVADCSRDPGSAVSDLAERLLASPNYGEHWARHWLDVVRFAESDGFETNQPRPNAWPYRDYVIRAFNEDKPYDQFIREQLAGDALGVDEATGFIVGGPWDRVKSPDPVLTANQRADELNDMVGATGSAFLGLTVNCARCHNHKFDPILQSDYYAMKAVFAGVQHGEREMRPADFAQRKQRADAARAELAPILARLGQLQPLARTRRVLAIDDTSPGAIEELEKPRGVEPHAAGTRRGERDQPGDTATLPNLGGSYHWWEGVSQKPVFAYAPKIDGKWRIWISWGAGWNTHAQDVAYVLDSDGDLKSTGDRREIARVDQRMFADGTGEPFPNKPLWSGLRDIGVHDLTPSARLLVVAGATTSPVTADAVVFEEGDTASAQPALRPQVARGENVERFEPVEARFIRFTVRSTTDVEPCIDELEAFAADGRNVALGARPTSSGDYAGNPFHKLEHINDGSYGNERSWISNEKGRGWVQLEFGKPERIERVLWSRDRSAAPRYEDRTATDYDISISADGESWRVVAGSMDRLAKRYPHKVGAIVTLAGLSPNERLEAESLQKRRVELDSVIREAGELPKVYAGRFTKPEDTFRFHRGDPMQPREKMQPGALGEFTASKIKQDASEQERRMFLAKWIASTENPLAARVIVNRLWHYHFGIGIVDTPSDFGLNGGRPTHPELLDWLAVELIENGWSLKHIHRLILNSATYRQGARADAKAAEVDGSNRLLWRFPARRIEAESLRDSILAVSGKLDLAMGGPGFDLFEPNTNYVKVYATKTKFASGDFRRMIYQNKPRGELDALFGAFDCPDGGQIQPRRNVSTTPLQALNLLNSAFILEQCSAFADRLQREAGSTASAQIQRAYALAFGRSARNDEVSAAEKFIASHGLPAFCRAIYNANEFITIY
jgi:mono/diheme cytochrome c family protein